MSADLESISKDILEISSEQRLSIVEILAENKSKMSTIAKKLDATASEIHRNLNRLVSSYIISKDGDGLYTLTTYGKMIHSQISSWRFLIDNKKFFSKHDFGNLHEQFIQSIGLLENSKHIKGFVNVYEVWKKIYKNADMFIYNTLHEVSYEDELINILKSKIEKGIYLRSIFSGNAIIPSNRKKTLQKAGFIELLKKYTIQRRIKKDLQVLIILNDKEAGVMFPRKDGEVDVSEIFYSTDEVFHQWCLSYFEYCWQNSSAFIEEKISKKSS